MTADRDLNQPVPDWTAPPRPAHAMLEGRFARLEPLDPDAHAADLNDAFDQDTDGTVWTYLPSGPFPSRSGFHRFIREMAVSQDPLFFAVRDRSTGRALGFLSLLRIMPEAGTIEVGYITFSPLLQRTPAASEAIILLAREAFRIGYRRFEWKCNALNHVSRRAAQRYGFSYEGIFRQAAVIKGRNRDTAWFAMIDAEFPALNAAWTAWLDPKNFLQNGRQVRALSDMTRPILVKTDPDIVG